MSDSTRVDTSDVKASRPN